MSYEKQTWQTGDVVTSAKLNHMEDGIAAGGGVLVVNMTYDEGTDTYTADKTAGEMWTACQSGVVLFLQTALGATSISTLSTASLRGGDSYSFEDSTGDFTLTANSASDYPSSGGIQ